MVTKLTGHEIAAIRADKEARGENWGDYASHCGVSFSTLKKAVEGDPVLLGKKTRILGRLTTRPAAPADLTNVPLETLMSAIERKGFTCTVTLEAKAVKAAKAATTVAATK
jgi:hypothetical protein